MDETEAGKELMRLVHRGAVSLLEVFIMAKCIELNVTSEDACELIIAATEKAQTFESLSGHTVLTMFDTIALHAIDRIRLGESVADALLAIDTADMIDDEIVFKQKMIDDLVSGKTT